MVRYAGGARIVVSGSHASGKSTLISYFALRHPRFTVPPDAFEVVDDTAGARHMRSFAAQLRVAADRLTGEEHGNDVVAERDPLSADEDGGSSGQGHSRTGDTRR